MTPPVPSPPPALEALLLCARVEPDPEAVERARALMQGEGFPWAEFLSLAESHGLAPLARQTIRRRLPEAAPADALARLDDQYFANSRRNLLLSAELGEILKEFEAAGLLAIPYKGVSLAEAAYGNVALRRCSDLDILVPEEHLARAEEIMAGRGYANQTRDYFDYHSWMVRERDGLLVELHWAALAGAFELPILPEWREAAVPGRGLLPEANLLCLSAHGAKHLWERLGWVCDVAELLRAEPDLDWAETLRQASANGLRRVVLSAGLLAKELLGAPLPENIERAARGSFACRWMLRTTRDNLFAGTPAKNQLVRLLLARLLLANGPRPKARAARDFLARILSPTDADREAMPRGLGFAGALLRPFRLIKTYWRTL